MTELTPPVQKNFYALGHKYLVGHGENKALKTYIGPYRLSDGYVEHVFVKELYHEELKRPFIVCDSYHDKLVDSFVSEDA